MKKIRTNVHLASAVQRQAYKGKEKLSQQFSHRHRVTHLCTLTPLGMRFRAFSKSSFSRRRSSYLRPARSKYVKINGRKKIRVNPEKRDRYYSSKTHNFCNSHLPTAAHLDATIPWYCLATAPKIPFTSPLMMLLYR